MATAGLTVRGLRAPPSRFFARVPERADVAGTVAARSTRFVAEDCVRAGFAARVAGIFLPATRSPVTRRVEATFFVAVFRLAGFLVVAFFAAVFFAGALRIDRLAGARAGVLVARCIVDFFVVDFRAVDLRDAAGFEVAPAARLRTATLAGVARLDAVFFVDARFAPAFFVVLPAARFVAGFALRDAVGLMRALLEWGRKRSLRLRMHS